MMSKPPALGGGVLAVTITKGGSLGAPVTKTLLFSG